VITSTGTEQLQLRLKKICKRWRFEPLGSCVKERNEAFQIEYGKVINRFTAEFIKDFCPADGTIRWNRIVELNSEIPKPKIKKIKAPKP
jgi:hypothetical protein